MAHRETGAPGEVVMIGTARPVGLWSNTSLSTRRISVWP